MPFKYHESCEECGSSDAKAVYDENTYCYSCNHWEALQEGATEEGFKKMDKGTTTKELSTITRLEHNGFRERKLTKAVTEFFGVKSQKDAEGVITHHYYPYTKGGSVVAFKERRVEDKQFRVVGEFKDVELFGQTKFPAGGRKIVITEGELDALAVAQAHLDKYGDVYPVVSIPSGAGSMGVILAQREYLRSFESVILMGDQDEKGLEAQNEIAKIIGADKAKVAPLKYKDASDAYLAEGINNIMFGMWNARDWCPAGIVNGKETWGQYVAESEAVYTPYPSFIPELNQKIFGRRLGSITTFTSGTGSGKTSFLREDAYHLLRSTDGRIGICSLEESVAETVRGFISLETSKRVGLPNVEVPLDEQEDAFNKTMGTGRFEILDHQGSVSDSSLVDKMEYMALVCDYIYLDHITIAVSETEGSVNQAMDKFMSDLLKIAKRHNVWFGVVSHLRKSNQEQNSYEQGAEINEDSLKGSGSLKQISSQIIALERNKYSDNLNERHTVQVKVLKDRFGGDTGPAGAYKFNSETGRLSSTQPSAFEAIDE